MGKIRRAGPVAAVATIVSSIDLWSGFGTVEIDTVLSTESLPEVVITALPSGVTIIRAVAIVKFRVLSEWVGNDAALRDAQEIQVRKAVGGAWTTAIDLLNNQLRCPANAREFGYVLVGVEDIKDQVPANDGTVEFQWLNARIWTGEIHLEDLQTGLRIWFSAT